MSPYGLYKETFEICIVKILDSALVRTFSAFSDLYSTGIGLKSLLYNESMFLLLYRPTTKYKWTCNDKAWIHGSLLLST